MHLVSILCSLIKSARTGNCKLYKCDGRMQSTSAGSGLMGHSIILCMSPVARALLIALCLQVHKKGGKLRYKYSSARPHGQFSVSVPRNDVNGLLYMFTNEGMPESVFESAINGPTDGP